MSTLSLPPIAVLATAAADLVLQAADAGNTPRVNALNKAALHLHAGIQVTLTVGGALIPSGTRAGIVYRISTVHGCSCQRGMQGGICWHSALVEIIEKAQTRTIPMADRISAARMVARAKAQREMDELFA
jgi:hypothetical protein